MEQNKTDKEKIETLEFQVRKLKLILYELKNNFETYQMATERKILEMETRYNNEIGDLHYQMNN